MFQGKLPRTLGFWAATAIVAGSIIGSGIFMKPATMALQLGSPVWLILVWVIAGVFSLFGAFIYAELGAMMPENGGGFVYFKHMYGEFVSFLYGWAAFAVINTAAVAAIAYVCALYGDYFLMLPRFDSITEQSVAWHIPFLGDLYPLDNFGVKALAIFLVIVVTAVNYLSVKAGSSTQVLSTAIKIVVIAILVFGIFFSGSGSAANFVISEDPKQGSALLSGIVAAMTGAFFAYDGWTNAGFIAGEIKEPSKNVSRSIVGGVVICITVYVALNLAYLYVLPVETMAGSSLVASDALRQAVGAGSATVVAALIVICTFGAINGNVMSTARVTYAMGKDKVFFPWAGREHRKFVTPGNALVIHAVWTILFIVTGSFDMLADMFVFITWIAYLLAAIGLFILRKKMKDHNRPYKTWGYPWIPGIFIVFTAFYLVLTVYNDVSNYTSGEAPVVNSLLGILLTALGAPLYFYFRKKYPSTSSG